MSFFKRDVWILKGQYFGIKTESVLGSDAVGQVVSSNDNSQVGKRVLLCPSVNWDSDPRGPETEMVCGILGLLPSPGKNDMACVFYISDIGVKVHLLNLSTLTANQSFLALNIFQPKKLQLFL